MGSQFVDFNADGHLDVVTATFDGSPHVAYGSADGFAEPVWLHDKNGRRIILTQFWDIDKKQWVDLEGGDGHCCSAVAFDWDGDGDFDLLLGDKSKKGNLYLQRNEGEPGKPSFTGVNEPVLAGGQPFALDGGVTAPRLVDWDGDGLTDIVCGSFGSPYDAAPPGGVYLYHNVGAQGAPAFAAAEALIAPTASKGHKRDRPNVGLYADPVDYDGDGDLDLVVGGYSIWTPKPRELNSVERERLSELENELEAANASYSDAMNRAIKKSAALEADARKEQLREFRTSAEMQSLSRRRRDLTEERNALDPKPQRKPAVWVFLRQRD